MKKSFSILSALVSWLVYAQPAGTCTTGTTRLGTDGKLYGCVETVWKKLTEDIPSNANILGNIGASQNINGVVHAREASNVVSQLNNIAFTPISVADAPAHTVGKIFYSYANKHFYQGVDNRLWHQIDNGFTPSDKCLELVYDKKYGDGEHDFIYCAIKGPDGRIWLNNNLGAEYANVNSEHFNPERQAGGDSDKPEDIITDWKAYGSLFEWGRDSDGHELINWESSTSGSLKETDLKMIGMIDSFKDENDPCPAGYKTPTVDDYMRIAGYEPITTRFTAAGIQEQNYHFNKNWTMKAAYWTSSAPRRYDLSLYGRRHGWVVRVDKRTKSAIPTRYRYPVRCIADR